MATINQVTLTISGNTGGIEFHTRQDGGIWATFDVAQTSRTQNPQTGQWEDGAIHAWLCTWSVRSIDGTVIRRDMLLIDVKRENEIWKATSRYRLDGIRTGRQAQAALLLAATGALRPIQERFK